MTTVTHRPKTAFMKRRGTVASSAIKTWNQFQHVQDVLKQYAQMILLVLSQTRTHWTMNYVELGTEVHVCTWCHQDLCALGHMTITTWKNTHSKSEYCGVKIKTDRVAQTNKQKNWTKYFKKDVKIQTNPKKSIKKIRPLMTRSLLCLLTSHHSFSPYFCPGVLWRE